MVPRSGGCGVEGPCRPVGHELVRAAVCTNVLNLWTISSGDLGRRDIRVLQPFRPEVDAIVRLHPTGSPEPRLTTTRESSARR